jgi:hypothetical protein
MRQPYVKPPPAMRKELFEWLETNADVPLVRGITWRGWAASTGHTAKELIAIESKEPGLSNIAFAALTQMYNFGHRLFAPCLADPNYIQLVQSSSPPTGLGTLSSIIRGPAGTMGHFSLILHKQDDAALLDRLPPLAQLPAQSPARETSKFQDVDNARTPARTPTLPKALHMSPCTSDVASHGSIPKTPITAIFGNPVLLSETAQAYVTQKQTPPGFEFAQPQPVGHAGATRIEWNHPVLKPGGGGLKNAVGFLCVYQHSWGRRDSTTGGTTPVTKANAFQQRFSLFGGIPSDFEDRCDELDRMAARYVFDYPFHAVCQKNLYDLVQSLKSRSDNDFDTFATLIYNVDGAYTTREPRGPVVQLACPLITNANSSTIKPDPKLRGLNTVIDYAFAAGKGCSYPLGEIHHPTNGLTTLTAANTAAFTRFDGLENGRPLFAVVAFISRRYEHLR